MNLDEYEQRLKRYKQRRKKGFNPLLNPTNIWTWRIVPGVILGLGVLKWLTQKSKRPPQVEDKEEMYRRWQAQQDAAEAAKQQQQEPPRDPNKPQAPPRVPPGQPTKLFVKHDAEWTKFEEKAPATVTMARVPWPPADHDPLRGAVAVALQGLQAPEDPAAEEVEIRSQYKRLAMRWHPDKFLSRFGSALKESEREAILDRVKGIQQSVNNTYDLLRQEAEESRGMM